MSHPIILGFDGRVMDGMHRTARALLKERETIKAVQFDLSRPIIRTVTPTISPTTNTTLDLTRTDQQIPSGIAHI